MDKEAHYFFGYAYPCSEDKLSEKIRTDFLNGISPSREILEKSFPKAFERLEKLAKKINKTKWDIEVLKKYWLEEHNKAIDNKESEYKEATDFFREFCKVYMAEVTEIKDNQTIKVKYNQTESRFVLNHLVKKAKIGNKVTIHQGYAIEIIV